MTGSPPELQARNAAIVMRSTSNGLATRMRDEAAPRVAVATGVYAINMGTATPYVARISNRYVGAFATVAEAVKAREEAMQRG